MNRNIILGRDFLINNGVRLYYDLGALRIGKQFVPLDEDIHISILMRLTHRAKLKPQSSIICFVKTKLNTKDSDSFENSPVEKGFIADEPGIMLINSIPKLTSRNQFPISYYNNTNKTILLHR